MVSEKQKAVRELLERCEDFRAAGQHSVLTVRFDDAGTNRACQTDGDELTLHELTADLRSAAMEFVEGHEDTRLEVSGEAEAIRLSHPGLTAELELEVLEQVLEQVYGVEWSAVFLAKATLGGDVSEVVYEW